MQSKKFFKSRYWIGFSLILLLCSFAVNIYASAPNSRAGATKKPVTVKAERRVSIIQIVDHAALNQTLKGIKDELQSYGVKVQFQSAQGNPALAAQISEQFVGSAPNVLVGIGTTAAQALLAADQRQQIPVVFSSVSDPVSSNLVKSLNSPGGIATGVSNFIEPKLQFEFFKKILPELTTIGIVYNPGESNSVALLDKMKAAADKQEIELILAPANNSTEVPQATQSLMGKVQAVFINNDNTALSAFDSIVKISDQNTIPVFCSDSDMLDKGALATLGPDQYEIGKQTGIMILKILNGKNPATLKVEFPSKTESKINKKQVKKLKIIIPDSLAPLL